MHSSRMCTNCLLPVSPSMHCSREGTPTSGVYLVWGCTWSGGVPGPGGCTWSWGCLVLGVYLVLRVYLVLGVYLVPGGVSGDGGCTWSWGVYLVLKGVPGLGECTWSQGVYLAPGGFPGPGGYLVPRGYLPRYSPCGQNDRHVLKHNLRKLHLRAEKHYPAAATFCCIAQLVLSKIGACSS